MVIPPIAKDGAASFLTSDGVLTQLDVFVSKFRTVRSARYCSSVESSIPMAARHIDSTASWPISSPRSPTLRRRSNTPAACQGFFRLNNQAKDIRPSLRPRQTTSRFTANLSISMSEEQFSACLRFSLCSCTFAHSKTLMAIHILLESELPVCRRARLCSSGLHDVFCYCGAIFSSSYQRWLMVRNVLPAGVMRILLLLF